MVNSTGAFADWSNRFRMSLNPPGEFVPAFLFVERAAIPARCLLPVSFM
jgi:hypothetical protein